MIEVIKRWFLCLKKRWRLRRISRAIGIKPYPWQKAFALGLTEWPEATGLGSGKSTAILLRLLMMEDYTAWESRKILSRDPDFDPWKRKCVLWYEQEYMRLAFQCREHGICVVDSVTMFFWALMCSR